MEDDVMVCPWIGCGAGLTLSQQGTRDTGYYVQAYCDKCKRIIWTMKDIALEEYLAKNNS